MEMTTECLTANKLFYVLDGEYLACCNVKRLIKNITVSVSAECVVNSSLRQLYRTARNIHYDRVSRDRYYPPPFIFS